MKISKINNNFTFKKNNHEVLEVFLKNGMAFYKNGNPYTGPVRHIDSNGTKWLLCYENGRIVKSFKKGRVFKTFSREFPSPSEHIFSDGSKLIEEEFFNYNEANTITIQQKDKKWEITQNKNAIHRGEPVFYIKTNDGEKIRELRLSRKTGKRKEEIQSVEEAKEYFLEEYGIDAEFDNLAQAHIVKNAIDDFAKLNYKNKGKKLFKGLKIKTGTTPKKILAIVVPDYEIFWNDKDKAKAFKDIDNEQERYLFMANNKPDECNLDKVELIMKKTYDWSNYLPIVYNYLIDFHPYRSIKGFIQHELGHILHAKNSLYDFLISGIEDSNDLPIKEQVSLYAKSSGSEFVAEYIAGRLSGKKYSKEATELYKKFKGPNLFNDWKE